MFRHQRLKEIVERSQIVTLCMGPYDGLRIPLDPRRGKRLSMPLVLRPGWVAVYHLAGRTESGRWEAWFVKWATASVPA